MSKYVCVCELLFCVSGVSGVEDTAKVITPNVSEPRRWCSELLTASQQNQSRESAAAISGKKTCAETRKGAALRRRGTAAGLGQRFSSVGWISSFDVVPTS